MEIINKSKDDILIPIERNDEHHIERHLTFLNRIKEGPVDLLFLGDSITRRWIEYPGLWNKYFTKYNPANFGVGGDTTQNLKWRILNGELEGIKPKIIVLLIGTNNLPLHNAKDILKAILDIINIIHHKLSDSKIILMGIFPRNPESNIDYMTNISFVNDALSKIENKKYVHYIDIGKKYIGADGLVNKKIMPDGLHIVKPGYKIWGNCLSRMIKKL